MCTCGFISHESHILLGGLGSAMRALCSTPSLFHVNNSKLPAGCSNLEKQVCLRIVRVGAVLPGAARNVVSAQPHVHGGSPSIASSLLHLSTPADVAQRAVKQVCVFKGASAETHPDSHKVAQ